MSSWLMNHSISDCQGSSNSLLFLTSIFNHSPKSCHFYLEMPLKSIYSPLSLLSVGHISFLSLDNSTCLTSISDFNSSLLLSTSTVFSPCHWSGLSGYESHQEMTLQWLYVIAESQYWDELYFLPFDPLLFSTWSTCYLCNKAKNTI